MKKTKKESEKVIKKEREKDRKKASDAGSRDRDGDRKKEGPVLEGSRDGAAARGRKPRAGRTKARQDLTFSPNERTSQIRASLSICSISLQLCEVGLESRRGGFPWRVIKPILVPCILLLPFVAKGREGGKGEGKVPSLSSLITHVSARCTFVDKTPVSVKLLACCDICTLPAVHKYVNYCGTRPGFSFFLA